MTVAYASAAQLEAFVAPAVWSSIDAADVDRLLARATEVVDDHVRAGFYVDSDTNLPTDTDVAQALQDATCAQCEFWVEVGEEHDVAGVAGREVSIARFSIDRLPPQLAPRAKRFLAQRGLLQPVDTGVWPAVVVP